MIPNNKRPTYLRLRIFWVRPFVYENGPMIISTVGFNSRGLFLNGPIVGLYIFMNFRFWSMQYPKLWFYLYNDVILTSKQGKLAPSLWTPNVVSPNWVLNILLSPIECLRVSRVLWAVWWPCLEYCFIVWFFIPNEYVNQQYVSILEWYFLSLMGASIPQFLFPLLISY